MTPTLSTDLERLDLDLTYQTLRDSYWAKNIPRDVFERSLQNSICFGLYLGATQVAFARVVTDKATFAYLGDVFVVPEHRAKGYSKILMRAVMEHEDLQGLRRFCLGTKDAQGLYEQFGFKVVAAPENWMEIKRPTVYATDEEP